MCTAVLEDVFVFQCGPGAACVATGACQHVSTEGGGERTRSTEGVHREGGWTQPQVGCTVTVNASCYSTCVTGTV